MLFCKTVQQFNIKDYGMSNETAKQKDLCDKHTKMPRSSYLAHQVADLPPQYRHLVANSGTNLDRSGGRSIPPKMVI